MIKRIIIKIIFAFFLVATTLANDAGKVAENLGAATEA